MTGFSLLQFVEHHLAPTAAAACVLEDEHMLLWIEASDGRIGRALDGRVSTVGVRVSKTTCSDLCLTHHLFEKTPF